jgi:16S rRNA (uracil1498-N3)-methyltransferase
MGGLSFSDKKLEDILKNSSAINVFIGPEGGWSENEIETFKNNGLTFVSLGETVLRTETAAITACALSLLL